MPPSLSEQLEDYVTQINAGERLFPYARQRLYKEFKKVLNYRGRMIYVYMI